MKKIKVEDAVGKILAHDITEIIPGKKKDVAFKRGKVIEKEDIERLLDLGKVHVYVFEREIKGVHEEEAALRIAESIKDENMELMPPKEGKVSIKSKVDGLFYVNLKHLIEINKIKDVLLSVVPNRHPVKKGDIVAATRIIPLYIKEKELKKVEKVGEKGIISIKPFKFFKIGLVITGSEVSSGRVKDASYMVEGKLKGYGHEIVDKKIVPDNIGKIKGAIIDMFQQGAEMVITTGGLSVDPDDVTKEGVEATGAEVLFYGTPVFPGAMFLVARLKGRYILGAPACVYYNRYTVLDMVLTRLMAGERMHRSDIIKLSYGGLCLQCDVCHYPNCFFGKGM
ncbi:MAG TPA: molybdopterin-binding protein [Syntrophorhabdaceae bacterium]|nr:molybdopterin-binding protein [Syntrophorhabdaceae bacterium]HPP07088.1 molybdopterin-binding protein [Syntrophorhabdaceae bacterium]